jgi:hypothetical protein
MTRSPWHRDRDLPFYYYVMLPQASRARLRLVPDGNHWALPYFSPDTTDFRSVRHIQDWVREQYGIESVVQRCVAHRVDPSRGLQYRVYALETLNAPGSLPEGGIWIGEDELDRTPLALPEHRDWIRQWLRELADESVPELRAPWARTTWFDEASDWIQAQLAQRKIELVGPIVQERAWALSCVLRMETSLGAVYFKAVPPFMTQESVVMREVSRQYPALLPSPLATNTGRGWTLMSDFGGDSLLRMPDIGRWEEALRRFARMQVEQVSHVDEWLSQGIPDRRLNRMVQLTDPLITMASQIFSGSNTGWSEAEIEGLQALPLRMKLLCANLASYGLPPTLVHGDLGGNILVNGDRYIFFDWTDVCIAHPFFEMTTCIDTVFDESLLRHETDARRRLRDAYLEPWTAFESMERLVEAFELTKPLGVLHQAMSYMWILMNVAADARWELENGLAMWLKKLLPAQPTAT